MNAVSLNNLWNYIASLSLTDQNKRWLSDRLIESERKNTGKSNFALRRLAGCWANDTDAEVMAAAVLEARKGENRHVESFD